MSAKFLHLFWSKLTWTKHVPVYKDTIQDPRTPGPKSDLQGQRLASMLSSAEQWFELET